MYSIKELYLPIDFFIKNYKNSKGNSPRQDFLFCSVSIPSAFDFVVPSSVFFRMCTPKCRYPPES